MIKCQVYDLANSRQRVTFLNIIKYNINLYLYFICIIFYIHTIYIKVHLFVMFFFHNIIPTVKIVSIHGSDWFSVNLNV